MIQSLVAVMADFRVNVRLGEHDINTEKDCDAQNKCLDPVQDIEIQDRIKHPQYDNRKKINDIALLKLKTAADVSKKNVRTICLPTESDNQIDVLGKDVLENLGIAGDISFSHLRSRLDFDFRRLGSDRKWKSLERADARQCSLREQRKMRRAAGIIASAGLRHLSVRRRQEQDRHGEKNL